MTTETAPKLWLFSGTVTAVNPKGLKLDSYGDEYLDYTKPEWRGSFYEPQRGEHVTIQCTKDAKGKFWIKTIVLDGHQDWSEPELPPTGAPATNRDLSIVRQVCLKAAAEIVTAWVGRLSAEVVFDSPSVSRNVLELAQEFERWAVRAE